MSLWDRNVLFIILEMITVLLPIMWVFKIFNLNLTLSVNIPVCWVLILCSYISCTKNMCSANNGKFMSAHPHVAYPELLDGIRLHMLWIKCFQVNALLVLNCRLYSHLLRSSLNKHFSWKWHSWQERDCCWDISLLADLAVPETGECSILVVTLCYRITCCIIMIVLYIRESHVLFPPL